MRDLVRQTVEGYKSLKLEEQEEGTIIFSAQEPDSKRRVIIKILTQLLDEDPQIAHRFRGLSRTIRQLNHPNITAVRDVGENAGLPYVVTRAIEKAQPLADKLDLPWAVDSAADLAMQIGHALEHAYKKGVLHGSLSPDNVVVADNGKVLVDDFGLAQVRELSRTHLEQVASPYLAPERLAGEPADARADVYSLATILYGLLAKRTPQTVGGQILPPSRFNPDVPKAMDQVVTKALSPEPEDRYPDVKTFLAALGSVTLVPKEAADDKTAPAGACTRCGATRQTGRFCRKCGARLKPEAKAASQRPSSSSILDEPIQVTKVEVGKVKTGEGPRIEKISILQPLSVTSGEIAAQFPEPLEMPELGSQDLWEVVMSDSQITMPDALEMPVIDWAEAAPPMPEVPVFEDSEKDAD
jgi:serine/threonine protein kinase